MPNFMQTTSNDIGKLLLRLIIGGGMLFHGFSKVIHGISFIEQGVVAAGFPHILAYGVYVGEVIGPILLIFGIFTRFSALAVAIDMIMAFILVHHSQIFMLNQGGGWAVELPALYLFGALALFFLGGGKIKVTRWQSIWA